ncbi:MAG TPA: hypothetical protein DC001_07110 [Clostridiales bacterium]|nr:hypothetical protein [Clostridiales bacterium]
MKINPILQSQLSMQSDIPLYSQLVSIIRRNISAGALPAGALLPSETELCRAFNVSRSTVRQAIGALEADGLVTRKQGRGTFVAEPKMRRRAENVYSFTSEISALGMTPSSTILEYEIISPPTEIADRLEMGVHATPVYRFVRIRNVDGQPLILETSYYPIYIYPKLTRELLETHSFYSLLYEEGIMPFSALDTYQAVSMSREEAEILNCKPGDCAFSVERRTRTETGIVYEFTLSLIRADRVKLEINLQRDGVTFARSIDA